MFTTASGTPTSAGDLRDYTLTWPRDVFVAVATGVLADRRLLDEGPHDVAELVVREAFVDGDHIIEAATWRSVLPDEWVEDVVPLDEGLLAVLVAHAEELPATGDRPYWSERHTGTTPTLAATEVRAQFVSIIEDLYQRGYFVPGGCVDEPASGVDPNDVLTRHLGRADLWPLTRRDAPIRTGRAPWGEGTLFDLIEVFHDLAARPRSRGRWHSWNNCGWHFAHFDRRSGQLIYRWRINDLLARSDIPYRLADAGEDVGRLIAVTDDARTDLAATMAARTDPATGDRVRHALAQFRARAATEHDKRSAVITLAGILEERRKLLQATLLTKDEDALFIIANKFAIRHQSESQKSDYDPFFLDWVFWWYLATIELTDRILSRPHATATAPAAAP